MPVLAVWYKVASMPQDDKIHFEHKGIGRVLRDYRLAVPPNQREYAWEQEHVGDLFSDFANAVANNQGTYFLGTIVLTRGEGDVPEVSDGQQRLATTTILLAAVRDYFARQDDALREQAMQTFLLEIDLASTDTVPKLKLNIDDNEFFRKFVLSQPGSPDRKIAATKESHKLIKQAAEMAAQHVRDILEPYREQDRTARLNEYIQFIEHGAQVIILRVPDDLNAFVMFETLNDRGLKASQADLIKNYLLSQVTNNRMMEAQSKWASMVSVLESLGRGDITVTYLHHLLITKGGQTRASEVLDKVRSRANGQSRAFEFLDEAADAANDYVALFNPDHSKWNAYGTSLRNRLSTIHRDLQVEQIHPLMFAVARHFSVKEAKKAFRYFVFWSVRFLIAGGRGGLLDRWYSLAAEKVASGELKTAIKLAGFLDEIIPRDALFEEEFSRARVSQVHLARYYLRALEQAHSGEKEPEFTPNTDETVINLEHVVPQNPGANWPDMDEDTARAYWRRIGNMTILQATPNSVIGNAPFVEKKKTLAASKFALTNEIAKEAKWGVKEIESRQKRLAKLAVKTWPIK